MAKLGKALVLTALAGAAAIGGIALYSKYKASTEDFDDDFLDFDDENEDADEVVPSGDNRGYVTIPRDSEETAKSDESKVSVDVTIDTSNFKDDDDETEADSTSENSEEESEKISEDASNEDSAE